MQRAAIRSWTFIALLGLPLASQACGGGGSGPGAAVSPAESETKYDPVEAMIRRLDPTYNGVSSWACVMPGPGPTQSARILVDSVDADVYVISLGAKDGAEAGERVEVWRDGIFVSTLELTDVQNSKSAARPVGEAPSAGVRRGDLVIRRP